VEVLEVESEQVHDLLPGYEDTFKAVAEKLAEGILIVTEQYRHVYANESAAEITGYSVTELLGMTIEDLIFPEDNKELKERCQGRLMGYTIPNSCKVIITRKNDKRVSAKIMSTRATWHGEPAIVFVISTTIEPKSDVILRIAEEILMSISRVGPLPIMVTRLGDGVILYANRQFARIIGPPIDMLIGRSIQYYTYDSTDCQRFYTVLKKRRRIHHFISRIRKVDGTPVWTVSSGQCVVWQDDEAYFAVTQEVAEDKNRVDNVIRDSGKPICETTFQPNHLVINFSRHSVTLGGHEIELTATEYRLFEYLARNAGSIVTHDQILQAVWGCRYLDDEQLLHVNMCRMRQKIGDNATRPRYILNKPGIGYMLMEHVCRILDR